MSSTAGLRGPIADRRGALRAIARLPRRNAGPSRRPSALAQAEVSVDDGQHADAGQHDAEDTDRARSAGRRRSPVSMRRIASPRSATCSPRRPARRIDRARSRPPGSSGRRSLRERIGERPTGLVSAITAVAQFERDAPAVRLLQLRALSGVVSGHRSEAVALRFRRAVCRAAASPGFLNAVGHEPPASTPRRLRRRCRAPRHRTRQAGDCERAAHRSGEPEAGDEGLFASLVSYALWV